jgi:feruloyl-CoA synthase
LCPNLDADSPVREVLLSPAVRACVAHGLKELRSQSFGSSTYASRAILLEDPPSIDAGEITDKGYINQRAVLANREQLVSILYEPGRIEAIPADK